MPTDQENIHNQQFITIKNLAIVASRENAWIFDSETKEWYDPESFEKNFINASYVAGMPHKFKVLNPLKGLQAADSQMQKIIEKKADLERRLFEYYQSKIK